MRYWFRYGLLVFACVVLLAGVARTDENYTDVGDGPSRGELFEARIRAELGPLGALSAAAAPAFILPTDAKGDSIFGIDVSHHNDENCRCKPGQNCSDCKIDWARISDQKITFVYVKASQGTKYRDPTFEYHWRTLAQKNIPRGAYHFMSADEDPIVQADNFLDRLEDEGKLMPIDLPPCLDLESDMRKDNSKRWLVNADGGEIRDFWLGQEPDQIIQKVVKWLKRVEEKTGRIPIIYTSRGWWNDRIKDEKKFAQLSRYPIWIANYPNSGSHVNAQPKVPNGQAWALWQFTETGRMKDGEALPGKMDVNLFNGTLGNFNVALGVSAPEKKEVVVLDVPKDTSNPPEPIVVATPGEQKDTSKPSEPAVVATPSEQKDESKPAEPVVVATPSEQKDTSKPSEPAVVATPGEQKDESKPSEPAVGATPGEQKDTSKSSEPAVVAAPGEQKDTSKPSEPAVVATPGEQTDTSKPSEPAVVATPGEPPEGSKIAEQQTGTVPDAKQNAAPSSPKSRTPRTRTAQNTASQNAAPSNVAPPTVVAPAQSAPAHKMMVEIVLVNGRVLRVDADIDPAVLTRLIAAVDGN